MKTENKKTGKILILIGVAILVILLAIVFVSISLLGAKNSTENAITYKISVGRGEGSKSIGKDLKENKIIKSSSAFYIYARLKKPSIKAGIYTVSSDKSIKELINIFQSGKQESIVIAIPEGLTMRKIAELLDKNSVCKKDDFLQACQSKEMLCEFSLFSENKNDVQIENFEGFFLDKIQGRICMDTGYEVYDIFKKHKEKGTLTPQEQKLYDEYKKDRHICEMICTKRIANKDNILIYPEGAWNITPRLTQTLFPGAARIAINGNGVIIPIGIVRNKKIYTVNIGKEISTDGACELDVKDITKELKEKINSLVGEIIFSDNKIISRDSLSTSYQNEIDFINDIMSESENGYTTDIIEKTRYYDLDYPENVIAEARNALTKLKW